MTPRIQRAIDIFLDAINEGTLAKGSCAACAVGNLVANAINYKPVIEGSFQPNTAWRFLFMTSCGEQTITPYGSDYYYGIKQGKKLITKTEFTEKELAAIEFAFETNTEINFPKYEYHTKEKVRADQIKGLEAVINLMLTFDEQTDDVNKVFTEKAELIPLLTD